MNFREPDANWNNIIGYAVTVYRQVEIGRIIMQAGDARAGTTMSDDPLSDRPDAPHKNSRAGCRILVVDDNIINCEVAVQMLQKLGCHAEATQDARDAIGMHARLRYDLILLDCQMPGLDGYQATALIRASDDARASRTAVIGWTSPSDPNGKARCIDAGMDDMICKPIERNAISEIIARWAPSAMTPEPSRAIPQRESDLAVIQQRFGRAFPELAALFQSDTDKRIEAMRSAAAAGNAIQVAAIAHMLGSSCASIGAFKLADTCRELETCCKTGCPQKIDALLDQIQKEYLQAESSIRTLLQSATL